MKGIFKNALEKTKNVMSKIIAFLKKKRFSIVTFIITLVLCLDIYSCVTRPNSREPTTASASNIVNDYTYYYTLPLILPFSINNVGNLEFPIEFMLIPQDSYLNNYGVDTFGIKYYSFPDPTVTPIAISESLSDYTYLSDGYGFYGSTGYRIITEFTFDLNVDFNTFVNSVNFYSFNGTYVRFYSVDSTIIGSLGVANNFYIDSSPYFSITFLPIYDIDSATRTAYDIGFSDGEESGYHDGINEMFKDISPFAMIKSGVDSLLAIELFPSFSIGHILLIAFGMIMIGVLLKVFLGG